MPKQAVKAILVATTERSYNGFRTDTGQDVPPGTVYSAWVVEAEDRAPLRVKVSADQSAALKRAGFGSHLELDCWLNARGDRIEYSADKDGLRVLFDASKG